MLKGSRTKAAQGNEIGPKLFSPSGRNRTQTENESNGSESKLIGFLQKYAKINRRRSAATKNTEKWKNKAYFVAFMSDRLVNQTAEKAKNKTNIYIKAYPSNPSKPPEAIRLTRRKQKFNYSSGHAPTPRSIVAHTDTHIQIQIQIHIHMLAIRGLGLVRIYILNCSITSYICIAARQNNAMPIFEHDSLLRHLAKMLLMN